MINVNLDSTKSVDINSVELCDLTDIRNIHINGALPIESRIEQFIDDVKNPYLFRVGETVVRVQYNSESCSLQTKMEEFFCRQDP